MEDADIDAGPPAQQPQPPRDIKLPLFWASRPAAWFLLAESRFRLRHINDEQQRFDHLLSALPETNVGESIDIIEDAAAGENPYSFLKERLLETHVLSTTEMLELLYAAEPMGSRKPSQLLTGMLQYCPVGEDKGIFFHFMFLQRLPTSLRSLLGEVEHGDPRGLAARADRLWAIHSNQASTIANVEDDPAIAAVASTHRGGAGPQRGRGKAPPQKQAKGTKTGTPAGNGSSRAKSPSPMDLAQASAGLCYFHWSFGEKARSCRAPCTWGN